jgi:16S rRNA (guanine966-N2)-methyltransferase
MRLIGGQAGGRKFRAPHGNHTRPATARVRASIFSRLSSRNAVSGARVLDIFAGSGSLGLEALSRGASETVFVDRARDAAAAITHNLAQLGLSDRARIIVTDFRRALAELAAAQESFGLVFIDAPFNADSTAEVLALIGILGLLAPDGLVITRQFHRTQAPMVPAWECVNVGKIGDHRIALYRRAQQGNTAGDAGISPSVGTDLHRDAGLIGKGPHDE